MKNTSSFYFFIFLIAILTSCSDDDATAVNPNNYFPLSVNNSWDYDNDFTATGEDDFSGSETISVSSTSQLSGNEVYELESSNPQNSGLSTLIFTQGVLYKNNVGLIYTGEFGLGLPEFSDIVFDLENVPIYNKQLAAGTQMFTQNFTFNEQFEGLPAPLILNFEIITEMGQNFESLTVSGVNYTDVISSRWVIYLEINVGTATISAPLLLEQEVSVVTNYFAKDVGLILSESTTTLNFETVAGIPLEDIDSTSEQKLTDHNVTLD